jgi:hypothetical protein
VVSRTRFRVSGSEISDLPDAAGHGPCVGSPQRKYEHREPAMSTHIDGLTVNILMDAFVAARTVDHNVTLVDDASHTVIVIDPRGRVTVRPHAGSPV